MIGTRLGPYELLQELGSGGMATVYRAYQPSMDRYVAVKVIHQQLTREVASVERFQREARLVARLEHPHILPVYDFDGTHIPQYIVMRYLAGGTLRQVMARAGGAWTTEHTVRLLQEVASALDYAHRQGIVHRDLKPSNIMVDGEGNAFLTDFGIARLFAGSPSRTTQQGAMIGTPAYMAPEQATSAAEVGPSADLYALAVVAFEMLTGTLPFQADTPVTLVAKHIHAEPTRASTLRPDLSGTVDEVLLHALAKRPEARYPSAGDFAQTLAVALLGSSLHGAALPAPFVPGPSPVTPLVGAQGAATPTPRIERNKLVTVLAVNAVWYPALVDESSGTEATRQTMAALWELAREAVASWNGQVVAHGEVSLLALWGAESTREDDAERAIRAALEIRDAALASAGDHREGEPMPVRMGVQTGLTLLTPTLVGSDAPYSASGAPVAIATRLAELADCGILIGHDTYREVRGVFDILPAEPLVARGRGGERVVSLPTYRVLAPKAWTFREDARGIEGVETAMVGRKGELELLQRAFLALFEDHDTEVVTVISGAGLGKSRLLDEFDKWADLRPERYYFFRGRATPATTGSPYALIRDMLSFRFEILENDPPATVREKLERGMAKLAHRNDVEAEMAHLIGHLAGFDLSDSPHVAGLLGDPQQLATRARQLFLRFFGMLAGVYPSVMMLEDTHNADDASLDLLGELVSVEPGLPLLVICLARPSLLDRRPAWGRGQPFHKRITLEPLDRRESRELVLEILKKVQDVPAALRDLLVERAEGNPLFLEELVKMLIEDRVITKDSEDVWSVEPTRLDQLRVPPTLAGLLQARLDTLLFPERLTLQRAAVIGRVFHDTALQALDSADEGAAHVIDLPGVLHRLVERGFLYRSDRSSFAGSLEYVFVQGMLRDVIYESLLRRECSKYHEALAGWLARSERAEEYLAVIAEHYEKAGQIKHTVEFLLRAGDRARRVCAVTEARTLFERALRLLAALLPAQPTSWQAGATPSPDVATPGWRAAQGTRAHLGLGEVARLRADYAEAQGHFETALGLARNLGDPGPTAAALYLQSQIASIQGDYPRSQALLDESLPLARGAGDLTTLAQVLYGLGDLMWRLGRHEEAVPLLEESLAHAREARDPIAEIYALNRLGVVNMFRQRHAEARERFEAGRELAARAGDRERLSSILNNLGEVERIEARFGEARDLYRESLAITEEIGLREVRAVVLSNLGVVSLELGELAQAEKYSKEGLSLTHEIGMTPMTLAGVLSFASLLARSGNHGRALELLGLALAHPAADSDLRENASPLLEQLRATLPESEVEAGLARGRGLSFEDTVSELLA